MLHNVEGAACATHAPGMLPAAVTLTQQGAGCLRCCFTCCCGRNNHCGGGGRSRRCSMLRCCCCCWCSEAQLGKEPPVLAALELLLKQLLGLLQVVTVSGTHSVCLILRACLPLSSTCLNTPSTPVRHTSQQMCAKHNEHIKSNSFLASCGVSRRGGGRHNVGVPSTRCLHVTRMQCKGEQTITHRQVRHTKKSSVHVVCAVGAQRGSSTHSMHSIHM